MLVRHMEVAYTLWSMIFKVSVVSVCCCRVLGSALCYGDSVLNDRIDWLWFASDMMGCQVIDWFSCGWFKKWWLGFSDWLM